VNGEGLLWRSYMGILLGAGSASLGLRRADDAVGNLGGVAGICWSGPYNAARTVVLNGVYARKQEQNLANAPFRSPHQPNLLIKERCESDGRSHKE
jgi:hypothetical protein